MTSLYHNELIGIETGVKTRAIATDQCTCILSNEIVNKSIDPFHKSDSAPVTYPKIHRLEQKCTLLFWVVYCAIWDWYIMGLAGLVCWHFIYYICVCVCLYVSPKTAMIACQHCWSRYITAECKPLHNFSVNTTCAIIMALSDHMC